MSPRQFLAPLLLALCAGQAMAQDIRLYRANEAVNPQDVASILDRSKPQAGLGKTRSIRLLDDAPSAQAADAPQIASAANAAAEPSRRTRSSALALPVQFAFDSADILPAARPQLDALAEGIRLLPEVQAVVIEGHTDAKGTDQYNEQLSQRRAWSVKRYLVSVHSIDPARLKPVGLGEYATLPGRDPNASDNRRVQFRGE